MGILNQRTDCGSSQTNRHKKERDLSMLRVIMTTAPELECGDFSPLLRNMGTQ
jgi:hypothetical protein